MLAYLLFGLHDNDGSSITLRQPLVLTLGYTGMLETASLIAITHT